MNLRLVCGVAAAAALAAGIARAAAPAGEVDAVVVFADRAKVTRLRAARCEHGVAQATFERLASTLDPRTLRGEVVGDGEVIGLATDVVNVEVSPETRVKALRDGREKLDTDLNANETRSTAIATELADIAGYAHLVSSNLREGMRNPQPATALWGQSLDGLRKRRASLEEDRRKLAVGARAMRLQRDKVDRELAAVGDETHAYRTATVTVGCRDGREVTAALSYVVPGATWQPDYDLDFVPHGKAKVGPGVARLTVGAVIRQATGEDWTAARISLSTARPKLGTEAPRPAPLLVDGYEQERSKVLVQAEERRERLDTGGAAKNAGPASVALDDKGNAFVLSLPHRVTVVADGRPIWVPVDVVEGPAASKLVATPKLDTHVFQVVALKNPADYPLLEGRIRSYRGGSYVGDTQLRYQGLGAPFEVSLGVDDDLSVDRQVIQEQDRDPSLLSSTKHIVRAYRTKLTNRAASGTETIELRENVPVSKVDDVKVEIVAGQTSAGYALDRERGFITWSVPLQRGEWHTIDLAYTIHLPDSWQVGGVP
ncbi:MAG TPA: mucoidy inhibitor MuiA family protein [Polyangia bacterium]